MLLCSLPLTPYVTKKKNESHFILLGGGLGLEYGIQC